MANVLRAGQISALSPRMLELFGSDGEPMEALAARARSMFPEATPVVWECQVPSLQFCYVSDAAKVILGYPEERWLEAGFWAETIVHRDDRDDAVTYCALATAKGGITCSSTARTRPTAASCGCATSSRWYPG